MSDEKEHEIKKKIASIYDNSYSKSSNNPLKLLKKFLALKFLNTSCNSFNFELKINKLKNHILYTFNIDSIFLTQETPPPNFSV